jgi:hypothetical protein
MKNLGLLRFHSGAQSSGQNDDGNIFVAELHQFPSRKERVNPQSRFTLLEMASAFG